MARVFSDWFGEHGSLRPGIPRRRRAGIQRSATVPIIGSETTADEAISVCVARRMRMAARWPHRAEVPATSPLRNAEVSRAYFRTFAFFERSVFVSPSYLGGSAVVQCVSGEPQIKRQPGADGPRKREKL